MKIKVWGSRGSLPTPGPTTLQHGGNTACLEITLKSGSSTIIDAGSGLKLLGNDILRRKHQNNTFCLVITHAHWDHLMGFPFFTPAYFEKYKINLCSGPNLKASLEDHMKHQMRDPYFPVDFSTMKAEFNFKCTARDDGTCLCQELSYIPLNHPNGGYGCKFVEDGKTFIYLTDNELTHDHGGPSRDTFVEECRDADLLIHDSQYTDEEYKTTKGWGHSTYKEATALAIEAGVKRFGLCHHDPDRDDEELERQLANCKEQIQKAGAQIDCFALAEGMVITP